MRLTVNKGSILRRRSLLLRSALPVVLAGLALLLLAIGVSAAPAGLPETVVYDPIVADIIAQVTTPTLAYELAGLTGLRPVTVAGISYTIATRYSYWTEAISMATRYAYEQLAETGLAVAFHDYTWGGHQWRNVVAEKPGVVDADEIYLITAHIDDMPNSLAAPGADDNASGSVAVLIAARLLAPRDFAYTIRFVLFTGEEQGLRGSAAYAADCAARGEHIRGVINLDMIAHNSAAHPEPVLDLYARTDIPDSLNLTLIFSDVVGVYGLNLIPNRFDMTSGFPIQNSDQWSFLVQSYPAFLAIEDGGDFTPYYHTISDTLFSLDLEYHADSTRAAIATLVHLSELFPDVDWGQLSGAVADLETGLPLSGATIAAFTPAYAAYTFTTGTDASGVYTLSLPVSMYTVTAWMGYPPYYTLTVADVSIVTDTVTVQGFALEPWLRRYLPVVAHDY
jgi:hypothetical protein